MGPYMCVREVKWNVSHYFWAPKIFTEHKVTIWWSTKISPTNFGLCALFAGECLHDDAGGVSSGKILNPELFPLAPPSANILLIAPDEQASSYVEASATNVCVNADLCCKALL